MPDAAELARRLEPFHAVMFGLDEGCTYTDQMKAAWGPALGREIAYVPCDKNEAYETLCARAGIQKTPTLSFGGIQFPGFVPLGRVEELLNLADAIGDALQEKKVTIFTRKNCGWCERQTLLLGPLAPKVEFVNCDDQAKRCAAAGVGAVPAWRMGDDKSKAPLIPGFRVLPEIHEMVKANPEELRSMAAAAAGGKTC